MRSRLFDCLSARFLKVDGRRAGIFSAGIAALCLALVLLLPAVGLAESPVPFADSKLEDAVRAQLGITTPTPIYPSDMAAPTFTYLNATYDGITQLGGLEYATSLETLALRGNNITTITPLANLTSLTSLDIDSNNVSDISPVQKMTNLKDLYAYHNQISDISKVASCTALTELDLTSNDVTTITPLADLNDTLQELWLEGNSVATMAPLAPLTKLEVLNLNRDPIGSISPAIKTFPFLHWLYLDDTGITDASIISSCTTLTILDIGSNDLGTVEPFKGLTGLTYLNIDSDGVTDISPLKNLTGLTDLNMNGDQVSDLSPLAGLTDLRWLYATDNQIWDISPLASLAGTPTSTNTVYLNGNWIDTAPGTVASTTADTLIARGYTVSWTSQRAHGVLMGTASSSLGGALAGAQVSLSFGPSTVATSDGSYLIRVVPTTEETVTVSKPFYQSYVATLSVSAGTTYTVNATLAPLKLAPTLSRSPSKSSLSFKRKKGKASFTLSATFKDARGWIADAMVELQKSGNGHKWSKVANLKTSSGGRVSKKITAKNKGTTYYRWRFAGTSLDGGATTSKQKVVVK